MDSVPGAARRAASPVEASVPSREVAETDPPVSPLPWRVRRRRAPAGFLSPAARRAARAGDIDAATVAGTGADGRVTRDDVLRAADGTGPHPTRGDERVPFPRIRARAAPMLVESKRIAAHALCVVDADYSAVEAARRPARARWRAEEGFALTYLPFVARAFVDALRDHPWCNARVEGDEVVASRAVHLGVAVDLDYEGLVVAVVRDAETRSLRGLARAIHDVAQRARAGGLTPDDVGTGTFTITNPGASGTWVSVPIIPRPQVAIVSTDGVGPRVVAERGTHDRDRLVVRPRGHLCLSHDASAVGSEEAAAFLHRAQEILEHRDWAAELGSDSSR